MLKKKEEKKRTKVIKIAQAIQTSDFFVSERHAQTLLAIKAEMLVRLKKASIKRSSLHLSGCHTVNKKHGLLCSIAFRDSCFAWDCRHTTNKLQKHLLI
jgi:hypothetical protein